MSSNVNPKKRSPAAKAGDRSSDESDDSCSENGYSGDEEQSSAEDVSSGILCSGTAGYTSCLMRAASHVAASHVRVFRPATP